MGWKHSGPFLNIVSKVRRTVKMMSKTITISILLIVLLTCIAGCQGGSTVGNLIGTVVREETLEKIPNPVLVIRNSASNPYVVDETIHGDSLGRFEITLEQGAYDIRISGDSGASFFTWPEPIGVEQKHVTIVLLELPDGY